MQFPLHSLTATESATGKPVDRIASGRRSASYFWTGNTLNLQQDLTLTMDRVRAFDMVALDRNHNLAGKAVELHASAISDFSSFETVLSLTLPTVTAPGSLDDALGVRTEEGAWLIRFPFRTAKYLRWRVFAVASYKPQIGGLVIGKSWTLPPLDLPWGDEVNEQIAEEVQSNVGWIGRADPHQRRSGILRMKLNNLADYDQARYHIGGHFAANRPMWVIHDDAQADRAKLCLRNGIISWQYETGWGYRQASVDIVEHEALAA